MTVKRSKLKPEVEFQYGSRLFRGTKSRPWIEVWIEVWYTNSFGPSEMSAMAKLETGSRLAILKNRYDVVTPSGIIEFGMLMQNYTPTMVKRAIRKPEEEFQYGRRLLLGHESSNISAVDWYILSKFGMRDVIKPKSGSRFATVCPPYRRHLGKSTLCLTRKFPPLNYLQLCQILTDFQNFWTARKPMKFAA